jgi:CDGSH iron-sulfur domain-containing protein 3
MAEKILLSMRKMKKGAIAMAKPIISKKAPLMVVVKKGETYVWCACGRSAKQPFCDGSHVGTSFQPLLFTADRDETIGLCACKYSDDPPYCDGSHQDL